MSDIKELLVDNIRWWWKDGAKCENSDELWDFYHKARFFIRCVCIRSTKGSIYYNYLVKKLDLIYNYYENQFKTN